MQSVVRTLLTMIAILMLCVPEVNAQSFSVESSRVEGTARLGDYPQLKTLVTNLTSGRLHLRISKKENMPPEWKAQMCFFQTCRGYDVSEDTGHMEADFSEELEIGFFDLTVPGRGQVAVKIENLDDVSDTVTVVFVLTIDTTTGIHHHMSVPLALHQNYPNPTRQSTDIVFELARSMTVSLTVTDELGGEVARLIDQAKMQIGKHSVQFKTGEVPSGVYLYRLETEDAVLVRKMVLIR